MRASFAILDKERDSEGNDHWEREGRMLRRSNTLYVNQGEDLLFVPTDPGHTRGQRSLYKEALHLHW
jgi:hypothetical protein